MTTNNITQLSTAQMKYLKWMLQTPRGTCNSFTLLELGLLPMQHEINLRKLAFLHHILNLDDDDPVKKVYRAEQRPSKSYLHIQTYSQFLIQFLVPYLQIQFLISRFSSLSPYSVPYLQIQFLISRFSSLSPDSVPYSPDV